MMITKCAKRLMATVMTTAIVLTGFAVAPKEVKAAEENPTVEVLGATLRLDNNAENCQSMRVGILVKNASKAKSCGIKLSIGDKAVVVSTENEKYRNIYGYDKDNDVVTYTAVIKDIPKSDFFTNINVDGEVTDVNDSKVSGNAISKNVDSIVAEIKKQNNSIEMTSEGKLIKKLYSLGENEKVADKDIPGNFNCWNGGNEDSEKGDASVVWNSGEKCYNVTTDSKTGKGIGYQFSGVSKENMGTDCIYKAEIKTSKENNIKFLNYHETEGNVLIQGNDDWQTVEIKKQQQPYTAYYFTTDKPGERYSIRNFNIYVPLSQEDMPDIDDIQVPLEGVTFVGECGSYNSDTKSIIVNDTRTDVNSTTEVHIPLTTTIKPGQKVKITISGTKWGDNDFRIWTTPKNIETSGDFVEKNNVFLAPNINDDGSFSGTVNLVAKGADCSNITLKPNHGVKIKDLVISDIKIALD